MKQPKEPTEQYACRSYWEDGLVRDCTCGKCVIPNLQDDEPHPAYSKERIEITAPGYQRDLVTGVDAIMQDLMVGHNFEYAREALLKLFESLTKKESI